jgi:hypothetical protein
MTILTKSVSQNVSEDLLQRPEREREKEREEITEFNNLEAIYCVRELLVASEEELFVVSLEDLK